MKSDQSPSHLSLPKKLETPVRWLIATITGDYGPGKEFEHALRHLVIKGGRGSAKSHSVARMLVNIGIELPVRFLCTREIQKSIDESVYQLLSDVITELGYEIFYGLKKASIDGQNGCRFMFAGLRSQDVAKIKSTERIKICWCEEAHVLSQKSLDILSPTIRDDDSVIIYTYNPELDDDPVHATFTQKPMPDVCVVDLNWTDNKWFPKVLEAERLRTFENDQTPGKTKYHWIWEGHTLPAVEGAIFANEVARLEKEGRIRPLDYDPKGQVHVVMDLGYGTMVAILVQKFASTVQIIGYREMNNATYHDLTLDLKKLPYQWGKVFMPHDASHRDPKYGKSHFEVMNELGWKTEQIPQIGVENYIEAGRGLFNNLYISDTPECAQLIRCVKRWRYQIADTNVNTTKTLPPMKDEFSHGAEALCYTAVVADQLVNDSKPINPYKGFETGYAA